MTQISDSKLKIRDGVLEGPLRKVINPNSAAGAGSIHDTETASKLGFRGGTVAGSNHMDLFAPLGRRAFGDAWFETGTLSLYFLNATIDREPVHAFLRMPTGDTANAQVDVWAEREDGMRVAEGSMSVGKPGEPTALLRRPLDRFEPGDLRILAGMTAGTKIDTHEATYTAKQQEDRFRVLTEPMDIYHDSKWGGPVVTPAGYVGLLYGQAIRGLRSTIRGAVGLFGAIEIRNINGPLIVDRPYNIGGEVIAVGQSPKTEYFWYETWADDLSGKRIAEHRMLLRFMKASSPLYKE